jgi:uncharacterized coiled-coil protein SlyX
MSFILAWFRPTQLDRIEMALQRLETRMSTQETALNDALAELNDKLDNLVGDVNRLIEAVEAEDAVDLTEEIAAVRSSIDKVTGASAAADASVPETAPEPPDEA